MPALLIGIIGRARWREKPLQAISRLMTRRLGTAALPEPDVDILASSNLRIGRYQAVTHLALVDEPTRRRKRAP